MLIPYTLIGVSVLSAFFYGMNFTRQKPSLARSLIKTLPIASLALLSFLLSGPTLLTAGLFLGATGDAFLSLDEEKGFLPGLGSFLIGHLCFVILFVSHGEGHEVFSIEVWRLAALAFLWVLAIHVTRKLLPNLGDMKIPVLAYITVIIAMGLAALQLPLVWPVSLAIPGAAMFIASDMILSVELFIMRDDSPARRLSAPSLWFLYWGGQSLIAAAFLLP